MVNLEGDLIGTVGTIQSTDGGCGIAFTNSAIQNINIADAVPFNNIQCYIRNGTNVQLFDNNLKLNNNSGCTVENGGTFHFNWDTDNITPLMIVNGTSGTNTFSSQDGSILKITHLSGLVKNSANAGNVQLSVSNKSFSQVATFWYVGKENQVTGDAITTASTGKVIICDLIDNNTQLSFTNSTGVSNNTAVSVTSGGKLDIRKGQVIESETAYIISSSGTLYMSEGTLYRIVNGNSFYTDTDDIPRMSGSGTGSFPYVLTGGTIELAGSGANAFQRLRSDNSSYNYQYVKFSGSNTYLTDYKNISSQTYIDSALIITGNTVVDCFTGGVSGVAASFVGNGGLIMDGGRLRIKKMNDANPELDGFNMPYTLTGGTIEFYGSGATQQQKIRGNYGASSTKISYNNIEVNAVAANYRSDNIALAGNVNMNSIFLLKGQLVVYSPAVFRMDETDFIDDALSPSNSIIINSGAGLLFGNSNGIKTSGTGISDGNIRISGIRSFSYAASYGFIGNSNMVSGNGLPSNVNGLYIYKSASNVSVTLTNSVIADNVLKMIQGNVITGSNLLTLGISTSQKGTLDYTAGYVIGNMRRWFNGTNTGYATGLFPIGFGSGLPLNRHFYIQFTNAPTSGGYLDVSFNPLSMGYNGLPINGIPAVGSCLTFDVSSANDQGYWVATPQTGTLSTGNYTLTLNGEGFNNTNWCQLTLLKRVGSGPWTAPATHLVPTSLPSVSRSGLSGFSNFGFGGGDLNILPVELISFKAILQNNDAILDWSTASEINNNYFQIERSENNISSFKEIGLVYGMGNSNIETNYNFTDINIPEKILYYRLKQVDYDGSYSCSNVISLDNGSVSGDLYISNILNDNNSLLCSINNISGNFIDIDIYDITGKLIYTSEHSITESTYLLNIKEYLPLEIYFLRVNDGIHSASLRFIR